MRMCTLHLHTILKDVSDYIRLRKKRRDDNFLVGCRTAYDREAQLERNLLPLSSTLMVAEHFCGTITTPYPTAWNHLSRMSDLIRCWKFLSVMQIIHRGLS